MKNIPFKTVLLTACVGVITLGSATALAQGLSASTNISTESATGARAGTSVRADAKANIKQSKQEKKELLRVDAGVKAKVAEFKSNLVAIKKATLVEKKAFVVETYHNANAYFTREHEQFVSYMNKLETEGVNVAEARAHFVVAEANLLEARAHLEAIVKMDLNKENVAEAKAKAKAAEAAYKKTRQEMRAGAKELKAAIKTRLQEIHAAATVNSSVEGSVN